MESEAEAKRRRLEARMGGAAPGPSVAGPSAPLLPPPREAFVAEANKALFFRLVRTAAELATAPLFNPEFTHQVFREDETVFGYRDLKIVISLHAVTFHALVEVSHSGTAPSALGSIDNIEARLRDAFPAGFMTERSAFEALLAKVGPSPPLPPAVQQLCADPASGARILHAPLTDPVVLEWHKRVAPFVLFFIDAGSNIDAEHDPRWELLVAVLPAAEGGGEVVAGFATLIRLFAWPDACRYRLSQVLVFPPLQRRGVAAALLGAVRSRVVAAGGLDYSVEDPTDALQRLREVADVRAARQLPAVAAAAAAAVRAAAAAADGPACAAALALPPAVVQTLREAVRACKPQARIIWEGLLFLAARDARIDPTSPAAAAFKDTVTRRIKGSAEAAGAAPPRKFVIDLEAMEAPEDAPEEPGHITPYFLMTRGVGKDGAVVAVQQDEKAAERAAEAVEELLGMEFARLARLAAAIK